MEAQILNSVAKEPPLLRWLHSHDPDRNMTDDLLASSGSIHSHLPPSETSDITSMPIPPTSSLFVPMYRRKHFILGQLYGPMSPNLMGLSMLAEAGYGTPPTPISRRFVADLSTPTIDFLEYEWFSDGKLSVTIHHVRTDGLYHGQTILLDSMQTPHQSTTPQPLTIRDLMSNPFRPAPTRLVMRTEIVERLACRNCEAASLYCNCPSVMQRSDVTCNYDAPTNWYSWIRALQRTRRNANIQLNMKFSIMSPRGVMNGERQVVLSQGFEVGFGEHAPRTSALIKMFLNASGMLVSHPSMDSPCRSEEEKRDRIQLANDLSCERGTTWRAPSVAILETDPNTDGLDSLTTIPVLNVVSSAAFATSIPFADQHTSAAHLALTPPTPSRHHMASVAHTEAEHTVKLETNSGDDVLHAHSKVRTRGSSEIGNTDEKESSSRRSNGASSRDGDEVSLSEKGQKGCMLDSAGSGPSLVTANGKDKVESESWIRGCNEGATKKKGKTRKRLFICECGKMFNHRGHYNEHRLCVHERVRQHKCAYLHCQSRFFKKSDRDRHMRSKHDVVQVVCVKCDMHFHSKEEFYVHEKKCVTAGEAKSGKMDNEVPMVLVPLAALSASNLSKGSKMLPVVATTSTQM